MNDSQTAKAGNSLHPTLGSACGRWSWRVACIKSHIALRYGIHVIDETHGGQAQHYGWPKRSVGVEWSWKRNTWFAGFEFWPNIPICVKSGEERDGG